MPLMGIAILVVVVLFPFYFFFTMSIKLYENFIFGETVLLKFVSTLGGKEFNECKSVTVTIVENVTKTLSKMSFFQLKTKSTISSIFLLF